MIISPSILAADFLNLEQEIKRINQTDCEWIHLDVMDGEFVDNITFGYQLIEKIRKKTDKFLDVHLMVKHPSKLINEFIKTNCDAITIHIEIDDDIENILDLIKNNGIKTGIAINPQTKLEKIESYIKKIDIILVMGVEPGFGGQKINPNVEARIKKLKEKFPEKIISVDGGVNNETKYLVDKADVLVSGSYLFNGNLQKNIDSLR